MAPDCKSGYIRTNAGSNPAPVFMTETIAIKPDPNVLSTGSTTLNLLHTGNPFGGLPRGKYWLCVGDSNSGKTFLSMTCFAEATINPAFANYRLIYDNGEDGMAMNLDRLFSEAVADRIEPPRRRGDEPLYSYLSEEFYFNVTDALFAAGWDLKHRRPSGVDNPRPFIYVLDSENSLDSEAAVAKFYKRKTAFAKKSKGEAADDVAGSFGDGKAKIHSENLRKVRRGLKETGSILVVVSQTRDNISGYGERKTRSGGNALKFYADIETWFNPAGAVKKEVHGIERKIGTRVHAVTKKNRVTGLLGEADLSIYPSFGIDDLGSCADYLIRESVWSQKNGTVTAGGLPGMKSVVGTRDKIIRIIEKNNLEDELRRLCGTCWAEVQAACALRRKNRYALPETD